jgi:hypothetical protein
MKNMGEYKFTTYVFLKFIWSITVATTLVVHEDTSYKHFERW